MEHLPHSTIVLENISKQFYDFGQQNFRVQPLGNGHIHDTYLVKNQLVRFVLQRVNTDVFPNPKLILKNMLAVSKHLLVNNFELKFPTPMPGLGGDFLKLTPENDCWRAFPFFEHTFSPDFVDSPEIAHEAARAIGHFLKKTAGFSTENFEPPLPYFHDTERRFLNFSNILTENKFARNEVAKAEIQLILSQKHVFLSINQLIAGNKIPSRLTHGDPKAGNVLLDQTTQKAVAVIDLDTLMRGTILADFGDMMRSFAPNLAENDPEMDKMAIRLPIVEAMIAGFLSETSDFLTILERENLFLGAQWIIYEQAMRFLTDFLAGDIYYKTSYSTQNLARARNQLALLGALNLEEKRIRSMIMT